MCRFTDVMVDPPVGYPIWHGTRGNIEIPLIMVALGTARFKLPNDSGWVPSRNWHIGAIHISQRQVWRAV